MVSNIIRDSDTYWILRYSIWYYFNNISWYQSQYCRYGWNFQHIVDWYCWIL